ncbi:aldo/keto reductase [Corynebacterium lubricantis]|uniref:aldo/keto reductase n=1 Tax=Corynebacterium lubricantis TaxID=541095 RepID=UPI000363630F|nr:aldo/keto reductase [Corynebacterium lubricantis]
MKLTLPAIGFGAWSLHGSHGSDAILSAIDGGYRLIDTAYNYENEGAVGHAIRRASVPREELIVTSKLPGRAHEPRLARSFIEESLFRAGLDYFDLYLIHWPNPQQGKYVLAWEALIQAQQDGLLKHIGVSNFTAQHIETLAEKTGVLPEVNQLEIHPHFPQQELVAWCQGNGIAVEAWSPLGRGGLLDDEALVSLAERAHMSVAELILSWHATRGVIPLPRSQDSARQVANLRAVDNLLDKETAAAVTVLGRPDGRLHDQDPDTYEEF